MKSFQAAAAASSANDEEKRPMGQEINRLLGGPPGAVIAKLVFLSILVGAFLALFGLTPPDVFFGVKALIDQILDLGFGAVREILRYLVYGAILVVPIWLLLRLFGKKA
jgi:hypothetical protein